MIVWLASYPRSGNTLARIVLKHAFGIGTYSIYKEGAFTPMILELVGHLESPGVHTMAESPRWHVVKTHEMAEDGYPAVYIVRDGRDAPVSYAWYILSFETCSATPPGREAFLAILQNLIVTDDAFGGWSNHVAHWLTRPNTVLVRFEDLIQDPVRTVREATERAGIQNLRERLVGRLPGFSELHRKLPAFFRTDRVGSWQDEMPEGLHARFWERHGAVMRQLGYRRPEGLAGPPPEGAPADDPQTGLADRRGSWGT